MRRFRLPLRPGPGPHPDLGRTLLGALLSLGLHALLALPLLLPGLLPLLTPSLPITVEILPPRRTSPVPAAPPAAPAERKPDAREEAAAGGPAAAPARRRPRGEGARDPAPPTERLGALGTDDSSIIVVVRLQALRRSPYRAAAAALLGAFPDARILAAGVLPSGEALAQLLIDEADALLVTTTNPWDLTATALLVAHSPALDLPARLARRRVVPWDPRALVYLGPGTSAFAREEVRALWARLLDDDSLRQRLAGRAALSAEVRRLHRLVRLGDGLPTPETVRLALSAEAQPALRLEIDLASEEEALALEAALPALLQRITDRVRLLGLAPLLAGLKTTRRGRLVEVRGRLPQAEAALLLGLVQLRLQLLPLPPEVQPPDLGSADLPPPDLAPPAQHQP